MPGSAEKPVPPIEQMLAAMESWGASDLLVCPGKAPAVRLHGSVVALEVPATPEEELDRFVKVALGERRLAKVHSEGSAEVSFGLPGGARFRLSVSRQLGGLHLFARALPRAERALDELGLPATLASLTERNRGLLLIAGGPGSGKSTTLTALVRHVLTNRPVHVTTLEDPIETLHDDGRGRVSQREIGTDIQSYADGVQRALQEGSDVVAIGALGSHETARAALDAALSGQLVLAAIDASDACRALSRVIGLFPEVERRRAATDLGSTLIGVAALRLLPRQDGSGRVPAVEVLNSSHEVVRLIAEQDWSTLDEVIAQDQVPGIQGFDAALEGLCRKGLVSPEVGVSHSTNVEGFVRRLRGSAVHSAELSRYVGVDVQTLLALVTKRGASDLHLSVGRPPILRVDGRLEVQNTPSITASDLAALMRSITSSQQRAHLDAEKELDFSFGTTDGKRFRVNAYHERGNLAIAFRAITSRIPDAESLGLPAAILRMAEEPHGLILVVGPTGAGKTTTLACLTDRINHTRPCHIITIEDPIEYVHKSDRATIHQREVGADTETFARALKYILRQDPDVVLIG
ncbi:MAG TPA: ATPase, T2SS/T4P/T4SS family, partial [Polyangiales bacterium]|nr:ATPase, T2SS/T4P/T4SS family [Polyangiales bacterium]